MGRRQAVLPVLVAVALIIPGCSGGDGAADPSATGSTSAGEPRPTASGPAASEPAGTSPPEGSAPPGSTEPPTQPVNPSSDGSVGESPEPTGGPVPTNGGENPPGESADSSPGAAEEEVPVAPDSGGGEPDVSSEETSEDSGPPVAASRPTATNQVTIGVAFSGQPFFPVGQTAPGSTIDVVITVRNALAEPVQVTGVDLSGAAFTLTEDGCTGQTLMFSSTCDVTFTATPPTEGEHRGEFTVSYGASSGSGLPLSVVGASGPP